MATEWVDKWIIFVQWNRITPANGMAGAWDPDTGGDKTFGAVRLSEDGEEPPTWTGCQTPAKANMSVAIQAALGAVPWARVYDAKTWTWEDALTDAGLQNILPEWEALLAMDAMPQEKIPAFRINLFGLKKRVKLCSRWTWEHVSVVRMVYNAYQDRKKDV